MGESFEIAAEIKSSREFSRDTVFLCHKWRMEGESVPVIADILNRPIEDVIKALGEPLTLSQQLAAYQYFIPLNRVESVEPSRAALVGGNEGL